MKKHLIRKNLAGFVTFYFALCLILVYSNIIKIYERLLAYDLLIRNADPDLVSSSVIRNIFRSQMKNAASKNGCMISNIFLSDQMIRYVQN